MKKIIVACGSGVATSQNVATRLTAILEEKGVTGFKVEPVDIKNIHAEIERADIYVSLVPAESNKRGYSIPVFDGIKVLTGMGLDEEIDAIIAEINK